MPALSMRGVSKSFGPVKALDGVDFEVQEGEVHALIGENGAGKSTLMRLVSGAIEPDSGAMQLFGQPYRPRGPARALSSGVAMIYQELNLAPQLTVEQNIMLGREQRRLGFVRLGSMRAAVQAALDFLDHPEISPRRRVADLGPAAKQLVEIARALVGDARVIVLDEPTSSLSSKDAQRLFRVVRGLRERGVSVVYISHFLEEVQTVADSYTVLRDGCTVGHGRVAEASIGEMIRMMVGRELSEFYPRVEHTPGDVLLEVDSLRGERLPRSATFELRSGEILGIAGLVGAGRTELLRTLFALDPMRGGSLTLSGRPLRGSSPRARLAAGMGLVSEDRKGEGLALGLSISENTTLSHHAPFASKGWIRLGQRDRIAGGWIERLGIRCRSPRQRTGDLSGGNQQKVALARLLHHDARVLLFDEPTRGIDVSSKVEVYRLMGELAARGKAILMVSSQLPELLGVCDRICVMHRGVLGPARPVGEWDEHSLLDEATRGVA